MPELTTAAEFDAYAANPRRYIVITDTTGPTVHKISCRGQNGNRNGGYFTVASVREAFEKFGAAGCSDRSGTSPT